MTWSARWRDLAGSMVLSEALLLWSLAAGRAVGGKVKGQENLLFPDETIDGKAVVMLILIFSSSRRTLLYMTVSNLENINILLLFALERV